MRWLLIISSLFLIFPGTGQSQGLSDKKYKLIEAAEKGYTSKVLALLNDSVNPNIYDGSGMSPLHYATQNKHLNSVKALVLNGAWVNVLDFEDRSPLHLAVHFNSLDIAEYLVQHKADVNIKDIYGLSPLFYSCAYGDYIMTDMFLFYSEGKLVKDPQGKTPFLVAVWGGHLSTANLLLKYFADIKETDNKKNNAIHLAVLNRDKEMIDSLISWGCDINSVNKDGYSCLDAAIRENDPEIIDHLIKSGADVNHKIQKGVNSLDLVLIGTKDQEVIGLLENAGARRNKRISFSQPGLNTKFHTGFKDAFSILQFEIWEPKYGIGFDIGASQRLGRLKVHTPIEDNISYQFRETRTGFHAGIQKQFLLLWINRQKRIGMNLGFDMAFFIGHNKASESPPDNLWVPMPSLGIFWRSGSWQLGGFALHQNMKNNELSTLRFGVSTSYRFNEMK